MARIDDLWALPPERFFGILGFDYWKFVKPVLKKKKRYSIFHEAKPNGQLRQIEAPKKKTKALQKALAIRLTRHYMDVIPACVHGYVPAHPKMEGTRHIMSNAEAHIGNAHILNVDIQVFFELINKTKLHHLLVGEFRTIHPQTLSEIIDIVTYQNRLPMGSPCSPVLSNMVCREMDEELMDYASEHNITYTRYVDDLSFSAQHDVRTHEDEFRKLIQLHGFKLHPGKRKYFGPNQSRIVTGLMINAAGTEILPQEGFLKNLKKCIREYSQLKQLSNHLYQDKSFVKHRLKHRQQSIKGQIAFLAQVWGKDDERVVLYRKKFKKAMSALPPNFNFYVVIP